jgi:hypothetical protein
MRLVIIVKYFTLPALLVLIAVFLTTPPMLGALLALCYLVETRCIISLLILMSPALPLSREHVTTGQFIGFGASVLVTLITTIGYVTVALTYTFHQYAGLAIGATGLMVLIFASYWLDRGAASRLSKVQYEH